MASLSQHEWNRIRQMDEWSIVIPPKPTTHGSWWVNCPTREAFKAQHAKEIPRMTNSLMARWVSPPMLGGKLP